MFQEKLKKIKQEIMTELERTRTLEQLEDLNKKYFSRASGELTQLVREIKNLAEEERPVIGKIANEIKKEVEELFDDARTDLTGRSVGDHKEKVFDPTVPGKRQSVGGFHILTQIRREVEEIMLGLGFVIVDGPELESEWYNFEAVNVPSWHPARDMQDTFYINSKFQRQQAKTEREDDYKLVLRTHTSNVQVRAMEKYGVPLKCIVPGRVYRNEATDARHEHTFHQIEGLMVDKNISIANFKAVLDVVIKSILGADYKTRIRPGFFPFVEPGFEVDLSCALCQNKGCRVCKQTGWVEFCGAGMVHPNVLRAGGVDPDKYSGFAFGFGLERLAMMRHGINDIRLFHSGDLRFLKQF
ncbi:MAG TPA: phenylalanine--tRNA ligase subunit alpha [bacterium]|nr:phenylalanine--tRNA ligase subunit alpha [bacterium]